MQADMPQISNSGYASNTIILNATGGGEHWGGSLSAGTAVEPAVASRRILRAHAHPEHIDFLQTQELDQDLNQERNLIMPMNQRRIVQVFIVDPNENVPLEQSIIYKGEQKLTDSTDQELFYEINLSPLLTEFNEKRVKLTDKEASKRAGKDIFLEPARIRDLRMVVTDIAKF